MFSLPILIIIMSILIVISIVEGLILFLKDRLIKAITYLQALFFVVWLFGIAEIYLKIYDLIEKNKNYEK